MIRARVLRGPGRPDGPRPDRRPSPGPVALVGLVVIVASLVAGCLGSATPSVAPAATGTSAPSASDAPTDGTTPTSTPGVIVTPPPAETSTPPGPTPSEPSASATAGESPSPSPAADGCSGSDANREFFAQAAASMGWPVYCAVLPDGWHVVNGQYRLANGGHLEITYAGPDGAQLSLAEGNICADVDVDTCQPRDAELGSAAFGDLEGTLGQLAIGVVLDVDRGADPTWRATGVGLSQGDFVALCAALLRVGGVPTT